MRLELSNVLIGFLLVQQESPTQSNQELNDNSDGVRHQL